MNSVVRNPKDEAFTSFLNADEKTFEYHYSVEEQQIIKIFNEYRLNHPYVNSVYMGRENGSFVRSHPRTSPTKYDPRERPWYQIAVAHPGKITMTDAYPSVTNSDINIGTVLSMFQEKGDLLGVIGMDVTLVGLSEKMSSMELSFDGRMELWDHNNLVLISSQVERLDQDVSITEKYQFVKQTNSIILEKGQTNYRLRIPTNLPKGQLVAYVPVKSVNQYILRNVFRQITFLTVILFAILLWNYIMLETIILRPVRGMMNGLKSSKDSALPMKMTVKGYGELADFQTEYNQLIDLIMREESELKKTKHLIINSLASLAEIRDYETGLHIVRTQKYVELLATAYNEEQIENPIPEYRVEMIVQCSPLHDIGKVAIPDQILLKPGPLTADEFEIMKKHTKYGKETIEKGDVGIEDQLFIETAIRIVYYHHERWDGKGYPVGLSSSDIPLEARIMSVADVYDALTTKRVYKEAISHDEAVKILLSGSGTQFDPDLIHAFHKVEKTFEVISKLYRDGN